MLLHIIIAADLIFFLFGSESGWGIKSRSINVSTAVVGRIDWLRRAERMLLNNLSFSLPTKGVVAGRGRGDVLAIFYARFGWLPSLLLRETPSQADLSLVTPRTYF